MSNETKERAATLSEAHRELIRKASTAFPAYAAEITPARIKVKLATTDGRMELRETFRDFAAELQKLRELI